MNWKLKLMNPLTLLLFTLFSLFFFPTPYAESRHSSYIPEMVRFEAGEHVAAGTHVKLRFDNTTPAKENYTMHLPNGLDVTYGELVALGDFYEIVGSPIALGKNDIERQARFMGAFNSFSMSPSTVNETKQILDIIHKEQAAVEDGIKKGERPEDIYQKIASDNNRQWNCITGGGCSDNWYLKPGRYLLLAKQDFSHFGENAVLAYTAGHQLALEEAAHAHETKDPKKLELAYALNGLASHFLSDRFASGHIRTPRVELPSNVTPSVIGSILVSYMHGEENHYGLHVHNLKGKQWIAYGDRNYFSKENEINRLILDEAMQSSVDEIFNVYINGYKQNNTVAELIPYPDEIGSQSKMDIASLFFWDNQSHQLFRRTTTANVYDRNWTTNWWGWSTLMLLAQERGLPVESQADLIQSGYGKEAYQYGLIQDKSLLKLQLSH